MFDFGNGQAMEEGECGTATTGQFPGLDAEKETAVNTTEHNKTVFRGFENEYKDLRTLPPEATSQFCQSRNYYCPQSLNLGQAVLCIPVHSFQEAKVNGFGPRLLANLVTSILNRTFVAIRAIISLRIPTAISPAHFIPLLGEFVECEPQFR